MVRAQLGFSSEEERRAAEALARLPADWTVIRRPAPPGADGLSAADFLVLGEGLVFVIGLNRVSAPGRPREVEEAARRIADALCARLPAFGELEGPPVVGYLLDGAGEGATSEPTGEDVLSLADAVERLVARDAAVGDPRLAGLRRAIERTLLELAAGANGAEDDLAWLDFPPPEPEEGTSATGGSAVLPFVRATVLSAGPVREVPSPLGGHARFCNLLCLSEDGDRLSVTFWRRFSAIGPLVWKGATLHLFGLRPVPDRGGAFMTTPDSLVVLEPDYLVQATTIAECFQDRTANPLLALLDRLCRREPAADLLVGTIVNCYFDECLQHDAPDFARACAAAVRQRPLAFVLQRHALAEIRDRALAQAATVAETVRRLPPSARVVEPTFYSARFGLQGRLDALLRGLDQPGRRHIIELKSGKAPPLEATLWLDGTRQKVGIRSNHFAQATCYDLLLDSTFPGRTGSNGILYSGAAEKPLRPVPPNRDYRQRALLLRNELVALERALARDPRGALARLQPDRFGSAPGFKWAEILKFDEALARLTPLERAYYETYLGFIAREHWAGKVGSDRPDGDDGFAALWRWSLDRKRKEYTVLAPLRLAGAPAAAEGLETLTLLRDGAEPAVSNFREGDIALLYPLEPDGSANPLGHQILKCTITALTPERVTVALRSRSLTGADLGTPAAWALEHDFMDAGYEAMYRSLWDFLEADADKRALLLGLRRPEFDPVAPVPAEGLRPDQRRELARALAARDYFLLQGPPGTGKTRVMVRELVRRIHADTRQNLLLVAFTNRAVDEICAAVRDALGPDGYLRLGARADGDSAPALLAERANGLTPDALAGLVERTRVFVSTVASVATNADLFLLKHFETVIVDESSQLTDPQLVGILARADRFLLIGDEKQLPAVVAQPEADTRVEDPALRAIGLEDLRLSLFERLLRRCQVQGWDEAYGMLTSQRRMHAAIARFPNTRYYDGRLETVDPRQTAPQTRFAPDAPDPFERLLAGHRVLFFPSRRERGHRKVNADEAARVGRLVAAIARAYGADFDDQTVGVITPFRAQIAQIYRALPPVFHERVVVDTVERFQGSQREVILVSFAVNHPAQLRTIQSLTLDGRVDRKLNVALTRAREHLVLLGCPEVLRRSADLADLLRFLEEEGAYVRDRPV